MAYAPSMDFYYLPYATTLRTHSPWHTYLRLRKSSPADVTRATTLAQSRDSGHQKFRVLGVAPGGRYRVSPSIRKIMIFAKTCQDFLRGLAPRGMGAMRAHGWPITGPAHVLKWPLEPGGSPFGPGLAPGQMGSRGSWRSSRGRRGGFCICGRKRDIN